jgi:hypothetical protein
MVMEANLKFYLPKEEIPMRDCLNGQRWRAVCINMESYLEDEIKTTEDFDAVKGLELAQEKLYELLSYFDVQTFSETLVDDENK